jgi:hypothetical protein
LRRIVSTVTSDVIETTVLQPINLAIPTSYKQGGPLTIKELKDLQQLTAQHRLVAPSSFGFVPALADLAGKLGLKAPDQSASLGGEQVVCLAGGGA